MALPELSWQFVYARLAWALVLAALVLAAWPRTWRMPRAALAGVVGASLLLMALPGAASPAWHLGLAFQYPSGLLAGLCAARLAARWSDRRDLAAMPVRFAAVLAVCGAALYLDAFGLLARGFYYGGFGPGAALLAVLLAALGAAALGRGRSRVQAGAVLGAVALFSFLRLPTGNLVDALIDPLLCGWALVTLGRALLRTLLRRAGRPQAAQAPQDLPALRAAGTEPFSPIKE